MHAVGKQVDQRRMLVIIVLTDSGQYLSGPLSAGAVIFENFLSVPLSLQLSYAVDCFNSPETLPATSQGLCC